MKYNDQKIVTRENYMKRNKILLSQVDVDFWAIPTVVTETVKSKDIISHINLLFITIHLINYLYIILVVVLFSDILRIFKYLFSISFVNITSKKEPIS